MKQVFILSVIKKCFDKMIDKQVMEHYMPKPLILYHGNCPDGFCAAWIAWKKFGDEAEYIPVNYGQEPPDVSDREVYILDFSYPKLVLKGMIKKCKTFMLADHHKTSEEEVKALLDLSFITEEYHDKIADVVWDNDKSGARLAWDFFFPAEDVPDLVRYVEDRDLWRWALVDSKLINDGLGSYDFDFRIWEGLELGELINDGRVIERYKKKIIDSSVKNAVEIDLDGHKILSVNTTTLISEIGEQLCKGRPFSATFFIRNDGKKVWSLRSSEGIGLDVSVLAKNHGGGGHKHAAGYIE